MSTRFQLPIRIALLCIALTCTVLTPADTHSSVDSQLSTQERLQKPGWWPRKATPSRSEYAGPAACAGCHSDLARTQRESAMARTSTVAAKSFALQSSARQDFSIGQMRYRLQRTGDGFSYRLASGNQSVSEPLGWAFGTAKIGQTYLFEKGGQYSESVFSYFESLRGFARTPGVDLVAPPRDAPPLLRAGAGRPLQATTAEGCFTCHNTAAMTEGKLDPARLISGVTCEACHGPGSMHAEGEGSGADGAEQLIFNPRNLKPAESVEFCGSCHRTWWDTMLTEEVGVSTVLAAPYRLLKSRCWNQNASPSATDDPGPGDARLTCIACHDPHRPLVREAAAYDKNCLSCHVLKGSQPALSHPGKPCSVSTSECVSCHMPKYQIEDMYYKFTDHRIRIVKAAAAFQD